MMQADMTLGYQDLADEDEAGASDRGVTLVEPSDELLARTDAFVMEDIKVIEEQFASDYGLADTPEKVEIIKALVEKWKGLTADAGTDREKLAQSYWDNIYSRLDPATFGMQ